MSTTEAQADGGDRAELTINDDVPQIVGIEAKRVFDAVECSVTAVCPRSEPNDPEIVVHWDSERDGVNGYRKARVIKQVLNSDASVEIYCADDGRDTVTFTANEIPITGFEFQ